MAFFLLTNDPEKALKASHEYEEVMQEKTKLTRLGDAFLVTADKNLVTVERENGLRIVCLGFVFSNDGFLAECFKNVSCISEILSLYNELRGQFIIIAYQDGVGYVINDKIGMLNLYHHLENSYYLVSSNSVLLAKLIKPSLNFFAVKQFLLTESTSGSHTFFEGVSRVAFDKVVRFGKSFNVIEDVKAFEIPQLSRQEYIRRIEDYFDLLNCYRGNISCDLSGGFDTRLVISFARKINELSANTNPNQLDGGIDLQLASTIANRLGIKLDTISNQENCDVNYRLGVFSYNMARDIIRSKQWPQRLHKKYRKADLILSGYGGESVRTKYNNIRTSTFYRTEDAVRLFGDRTYECETEKVFSSYLYNDKKQRENLAYTLERMRVWGGAQVYLHSLYGKILHPFMDWYLVSPIFGFSKSSMQGRSFQLSLINSVAPELINIPVNSLKKSFLSEISSSIKMKLKNYILVRYMYKKSLMMKKLFFKTESLVNKFYQEYDKEMFNDDFLSSCKRQGIDIDRLEKYGEINSISRLATVNEIYLYVNE